MTKLCLSQRIVTQFLLPFGQEEVPSSPQPPPLPTAAAPKSSPQKKMLSMFDDDDEDEGDLFAAVPSKPAAEGKRKDVSAPLCNTCISASVCLSNICLRITFHQIWTDLFESHPFVLKI